MDDNDFAFDDPEDSLAAQFDGRDKPISFWWTTRRDDWLEALHLPELQRKNQRRARNSLLIQAYRTHQAVPEQGTSYSRRKSFYTGQSRYQGTAYTYANVLSAVDGLARCGLLEHRRSTTADRGWQSSFRASLQLIEAARSFQPSFVYRVPDPGLIQLKDQNKRRIDYRDTEYTHRARRNLIELNQSTRSIAISVMSGSPVPDSTAVCFTKDSGSEVLVDTARDQYYRVYNLGRFTQGGRLYGPFWQSTPKRDRSCLLIDGECTAEPDYRGLHPRLLYETIGQRLQTDPYLIAGWERRIVKLAFNIMVNADSVKQAAGAIAVEIGGEGAFKKARLLMGMIEVTHAAISDFFCRGAARWLQRADSDMAEFVMLRAFREGIPTLGVHDSFITPKRHEGRVEELMEEAFERMARKLRRNDCADSLGLAA